MTYHGQVLPSTTETPGVNLWPGKEGPNDYGKGQKRKGNEMIL